MRPCRGLSLVQPVVALPFSLAPFFDLSVCSPTVKILGIYAGHRQATHGDMFPKSLDSFPSLAMHDTLQSAYAVRTDELRRLMREKGFSLESLAKRALVSVKTLKRILNGAKAFIATIKKIADALGVPCDYLLGGASRPMATNDSATSSAGFKVKLGADVPLEDFDETSTLFDVLKAIRVKTAQKGQIIVIAITPGSVNLECVLTEEADVHALARAFAARSLQDLAITTLELETPVDIAHDVAVGFASTMPDAAPEKAAEVEATLRNPLANLWKWLAVPVLGPNVIWFLPFALAYGPEDALRVYRGVTGKIKGLSAVIPPQLLEAARARLAAPAAD